MKTRRAAAGRFVVAIALAAVFSIGLSALTAIAAPPCGMSNGKPARGPRCADVFCDPCEELTCGRRGPCDLICVPIPGCVP